MKYKYLAITQEGTETSDVVNAKNKKEAIAGLESKGLTVEKINLVFFKSIEDIMKSGVTGIGIKDKIVFTKNLSVMIKAGLTLDESLTILAEQSTNPLLAKAILDIQFLIRSGKTLSEAMNEHPKIFSELFVNIVDSSEKGGTLEESLQYLSVQMERTYDLRVKIRNALFYPIIIIVSTTIVGILLSIFVLPKVTRLFVSMRTQLPATTRALIWFSDTITRYPFFLILGLLIIFVGIPMFLRMKKLRPITHRGLLRFPIFGRISHGSNIALFSRTLGTLLKSGVPINQALGITANTLRNVAYRDALMQIAAAQETGETLGSLLRQYPKLFPPIVHRMISVGEESGNLEDLLEFLSEFYEDYIDNVTKNLSSLLEPILLIIIGAAVAIVALAIITPIYSITGSFNF